MDADVGGRRHQGDRDPPGQGEQDGVVGARGDDGAGDRHHEDPAGEQQAVGPRRRDPRHGREDDVRPAPEGAGAPHLRRAEEDRHPAEVPGAAPRDGLQQCEDELE